VSGSSLSGKTNDTSYTSTPISNYIGGINSSPFGVAGTSNLIAYAALALGALAVFMLMRK